MDAFSFLGFLLLLLLVDWLTLTMYLWCTYLYPYTLSICSSELRRETIEHVFNNFISKE